MVKLKVILACVCLFLVSEFLQAQHTQVIAHRGFWNVAGSAQNSVASFAKADSIGCYGSEFDVWLTADNELVINHDDAYKGVTIQDAPAEQATALLLENGEHLPTLRQYLMAARPLKTRLIVELKSHKTAEQETRAVEKIIEMVEELNLATRVEYIAFSLHATKEFIRLAPQGTPVYYLNGDLSPRELKALGCTGPDYHLSVFQKHPEWIEECHKLGMKVNVWTVNDAADMRWLIERSVDYITTDNPVLLQSLLK